MKIGQAAMIAGAVLVPSAGVAAWALTRHHGDGHEPTPTGGGTTPSHEPPATTSDPGAAPGTGSAPAPSATPGQGSTPVPSPTPAPVPTPGPTSSPTPGPTSPPVPDPTTPPTTQPAPAAAPTDTVATSTVYVVKSGDTVSAIARRFHVTVDAIATANHLADPGRIRVGQRLVIPGASAPAPAPTPTPAGPPATPPPSGGGQDHVPAGAAIYSVHTGRKLVALTFDDGPNGAYTDAVLATLARHRVHATFFVVGQQVASDPARVRREVAAGHAIGDHSWDHSDLTRLSDTQVRSQLTRTSDAIERATGHRPDFFRAPYGARNGRVDADARAVGMRDILWDVDTVDWSRPGTRAIHDEAVNSARAGSIVLMHDGGGNRSQTVAALDSVITDLQARGYQFVTVPELVAAGG